VSLTAVEFFHAKTVRYVDLCENDLKRVCRMAASCHFQVCVVAEDGEMHCFVSGGVEGSL
jgi:hypothetical protein